jgi:ABC-2 type transport system ATP-binding protein
MVQATGLVKRFGEVVALDGLDLAVPEGTILGLLGPNGAGKTTAVSILTTLLEPDEGTAIVAGADVRAQPGEVRKRIGLSGQYAAVDEHLTGFENLDMIGRLYRLGRSRSRQRATELLERFALTDAGGRPVKTYSGGMRRRLDLAGALVAEPPVLFLDEPTTGLDPRSRIDLWALIRELVARGTTLLLTTQYLEEADQLADDIVVIDQGRAIAHGTADDLKEQVGGERIEVVTTEEHIDQAVQLLTPHAVGELQVDRNVGRVLAPTSGGPKALRLVLADLEASGIDVRDVGLRRPTLDDVFLTLTGHSAEATPEEGEGAGPDTPAGAKAQPDTPIDPVGPTDAEEAL